MIKALESAANRALQPYSKRGWTLQMFCASDTECTVLYGTYDVDTFREEGVRVTATVIRTETGQDISVAVITL